MKKIFIILFAVAASLAATAQNILCDCEGAEIGSQDWWWDRCQPVIVENDGVKCLKFTIWREGQGVPGAQDWEKNNIARGFSGQDFSSKRMIVRLRKSTATNVRLTLEKINSGENYTIAKWHDGKDEWTNLVYDFNGRIADGGVVDALQIYAHIESGETETEDCFLKSIIIEQAPSFEVNDGVMVCHGSWAIGGNCDISAGWQDYTYNDFSGKLEGVKKIDMSDARYYGTEDDLKNTLGDIPIITTAINNVSINEPQSKEKAFSVSGCKVSANYKGIVIKNGRKLICK
ncbi:MAG: hypothetical protein HUK06_04915 [Bacteroidaceae bacterium]|nr:hypothetical protein [Bacteroidaceae bacterium]